MARAITAEERAILAHRVIDVDLWAVRAANEFGDIVIDSMVAAYRASYEAEKNKPGYKNAAQRYADEQSKIVVLQLSSRDAAINALLMERSKQPNAPRAIRDWADEQPA